MAGFCKNCGSPLADDQRFCTKCGVAVGAAAARAAAPGLSPVSPMATAQQKSNNRTLIKVLLVGGAVIVLFGIAGIAGLAYLGYHFKGKMHEMGLDDPRNMQYHGPVLGGADPCTLLSKEEVSEAVKMPVVRAERTPGMEVGCEYSVTGSQDDMIAAHIAASHKAESVEAQRREMQSLSRSFSRSPGAQFGTSRHPGEAVVFMFIVDNNAAKMQMGMMRTAFSRLAPGSFNSLDGLGEDAFDIQNALLMARQGDNIVRVMYATCPCSGDDAQTLVRKIISNMSEN
jgi:hypothetical protein